MAFVNRERELEVLQSWWAGRDVGLALVWGRRRIGKTALVQQFAAGKRVVYHTGAGRPPTAELALLSVAAAHVLRGGVRDLEARPLVSWDDALDSLAEAARSEPLLLVLDGFPELADVSPELEGVIRATWDRVGGRTQLRILLTGSALTSNVERVYPFQVLLPASASGLERDSKAQAEQVRSIAVERVGETVGLLPAELLAELDETLRLHFAL